MRGTIYLTLPVPPRGHSRLRNGRQRRVHQPQERRAPPVAVSSASAIERPDSAIPRSDRHAGGAGRSRSRRRSTGPRHRDAGRARHARREGDALIRIAATEMEAQARRGRRERRPDRRPARTRRRIGVRRSTACPKSPTRAPTSISQKETSSARRCSSTASCSSKADFDQRSAQAEVARRQYDIARNGALQQYQALLAARARVSLAKKALADTVVRSPFAGVVGQRLVSVGDYVARGTKVASVHAHESPARQPHRAASSTRPRSRSDGRCLSRSMPRPASSSKARCATCRRPCRPIREPSSSKRWSRTMRES